MVTGCDGYWEKIRGAHTFLVPEARIERMPPLVIEGKL
jgi:hypothetical protein